MSTKQSITRNIAMNFLSLASMLIPGYETLPVNIRVAFEKTDSGKKLTDAIEQLSDTLEPAENIRFFPNLWQMMSPEPTRSREENIEHAKECFNYRLSTSLEYGSILYEIRQIKERSALIKSAYLDLLESTCKEHLNILNIDIFNTQHVKTLANLALATDEWLTLYETSLLNHIKNNISHINGKEPFQKSLIISKIHARDSLANLYAYMCSVRNNQKEIKWCIDTFYGISDAHAFLQATGFATQNETSWLAGFDIVNYFRLSGYVAETKSILSKFMQPFTPLYAEYSSINKEQNILRQIYRTLMPMLIVSATVILVSALLSCFVIPEIAFLFILIPTLYLGLVAASSYVVTKDLIYNKHQQHRFGGQFEVPEYKTNNEMIASFGNATANKVRDFYVGEISLCFTKEEAYQTKVKLNQDEIESRQKKSDRSRELQFEWYDIHSNPKLSTNATVNIALNRLQRDGRDACDAIQKNLKNELENEIPAFVHDIAKQVKSSLESLTHTPSSRQHIFSIKDSERHCFFTRPACFKHREDIERLNVLRDEINSQIK